MYTGIVTINTDAGYYPNDKVGSYAYWIKGHNLFLRGSGIFKKQLGGSTEAEKKSIINALHILEVSGYTDIKRLIINRDNINANASNKINDPLGKMIKNRITRLRKKSTSYFAGPAPFFEFRHVKAHNGKSDKRSWVNDWCDKQCTIELKKYRAEKQNKFS